MPTSPPRFGSGSYYRRVSAVACVWFTACAPATPKAQSQPDPKPAGSDAKVDATVATPAVEAPSPVAAAPAIAWQLPAPKRIVALGDVHGDIDALRRALRLGGVLAPDDDRWVGGDTVVVQTGDQLDRGDDEQQILDLLVALQEQARAAGGEVHILNGNHELMNAQGDFRYVTPGGFKDFEDAPGAERQVVARVPAQARARAAAFLPGGHYAKQFAARPIVLQLGDTVFVHGGVTPDHVKYGVDRIHAAMSAWLQGGPPPDRATAEMMIGPRSPIWVRDYSADPDAGDCEQLATTLQAMGATRMVMGHTVQPQGATSVCEGKAWLIDVGMAKHYGGPIAALEIRGRDVRPLAGETSTP